MMMKNPAALVLGMTISILSGAISAELENPFQTQLNHWTSQLNDSNEVSRIKAVEHLSAMRATEAAEQIVGMLGDECPRVRREAVMYMAWSGKRQMMLPLLNALADDDWTVRKAAHLGLELHTGLQLEFNAQEKPQLRAEQIEKLQDRLALIQLESHVESLMAQAEDDQLPYFKRCDALRAVARMADPSPALSQRLIELLRPYKDINLQLDKQVYKDSMYSDEGANVHHRAEKHFIQAGIKALGKIATADSAGEQYLIELLDRPDWAAYAMEAMLDCGGPASVDAVMTYLPKFSFKPETREIGGNRYGKLVEVYPWYDAPNFSMIDRVPRLYFSALRVLSRLPINDEQSVKMKGLTPYLVVGIPNNWDSTMIYQREPVHEMIGYLLDIADMRQPVIDAAFNALGESRPQSVSGSEMELVEKLVNDYVKLDTARKPPYAGHVLAALCNDKRDVPSLLKLLEYRSGWVRMDAAKALMAMDAHEAADKLRQLLRQAPDDASYGVSMDFETFYDKEHGDGFDEFNDPSPRFKEAWLLALGKLGDDSDIDLLTEFAFNDKNVLEVQYAAAKALCKKSASKVGAVLQRVESQHPYFSIKLLAREALWQRGLERIPASQNAQTPAEQIDAGLVADQSENFSYVFIQADHDIGNDYQISKDLTAYATTDSGPTYRYGKNIFKFTPSSDGQGELQQVTQFTNAHVADLEVHYDGEWLVFAKRDADGDDPWWHLFEVRQDGTGLKQLTFGPYHDVQPVHMPDGRIAFSSTRLGYRDEYHGYLSTGLTTMNRDGSDIRVIGYNFGRDSEASISSDGRLLFTRLELFYSRLKTEWNLMSAFPDGYRVQTLYGPERRQAFLNIKGANSVTAPRHRLLRITQPQPWGKDKYIINSFDGPMVIGPGKLKERKVMPNSDWAVTCPYPLNDEELLVSAGKRPPLEQRSQFHRIDNWEPVNHGIYRLNVETAELTLVYDDPSYSAIEARPLRPRFREPILPSNYHGENPSFTGTMMCSSVKNTRKPQIAERGKYVRINEGMPQIARHQTHKDGGVAWRNHGGAVGRILGTVPLADDGSFSVEIPADRMVHFQVLDSDRQVVGNELIWQYVRPGATTSCIGCHEKPDLAPVSQRSYPLALREPAVPLMPSNDDIIYRAKMWYKGWAPDEREERIRTVNAINSFGRE
ncbi:HEAT repeat domain-containing protein [Persicirhabdus sediminis]|uniref:HEAT repeat domain-containing protein n=1 Tax=Persicirhabdus sediminis TaxID=454144 RepID=A0A8J7MJL6_9BACT|nr:HEAT repeat domain-containing protein [Persicirhabdus sediminis]MBK1792208.1 HEAT repeat domain-containing protein [Persicirhabdus sediminis]